MPWPNQEDGMRAWLARLASVPVIAVIRVSDPDLALSLAATAIRAGIWAIEITTTIPDFDQVIGSLSQQHPQACIGAGTLLDEAMTLQAIAAGSQFLVSPIFLPRILDLGCQHHLPVIPGALTPAEIWQAFQAGATAVKVFPAESMGGSDYIKQLHQPFPALPLIPTGGVTLDNAQDYLAAGSVAVGLGQDLFPMEGVIGREWVEMEKRIREFLIELKVH